MLSKVNVVDILTDHLDTLRRYGDEDEGVPRGDLVLFVGVPVAVSAAMLFAGLVVSKGVVSVLFTGIAVFAGLLFNLLLLSHTIIRQTVENPRWNEEVALIREIYANVSYSILISILILGVLLLRFISNNAVHVYIVSAITYVLVVNFLLTLLMVLKRIHTILKCEFDPKLRRPENGGR